MAKKWTDPTGQYQSWNEKTLRGKTTYYLSTPKGTFKFATSGQRKAKYEELLKPKTEKETENVKRLKRLESQPKGYAGSLIAQQDSAIVEGKLPEFTTAFTKEARKAQEKIDKEDAAYKEKLYKAELQLAKIHSNIEKAKITIETYENSPSRLTPDEKIKVKQAKRTLELEKFKETRLLDKYPDLNNDPLNLGI